MLLILVYDAKVRDVNGQSDGNTPYIIVNFPVLIKPSLSEQLDKKQAESYRYTGCYQSRNHKGMVQNIFPDMRRTRAVEIDGGNYCRIVRDKEVAVHCREESDQHIRRNAQRDSQWQ